MRELDSVVLARPLTEHGLQAGDVGAIVHVYDDGRAFEVEFVSGGGSTVALVTLEKEDIRPLAESEILHVRDIPA